MVESGMVYLNCRLDCIPSEVSDLIRDSLDVCQRDTRNLRIRCYAKYETPSASVISKCAKVLYESRLVF